MRDSFNVPIGTDSSASLGAKRCLANGPIFPGEYNPHGRRLWLIGNEFGPVALVWGTSEQEALDEAWDADLLKSFDRTEEFAEMDTRREAATARLEVTKAGLDWAHSLRETRDETDEEINKANEEHQVALAALAQLHEEHDALHESSTFLGNASEPADLTYAWVKPVRWEDLDESLRLAFAEARGAGVNLLSEL